MELAVAGQIRRQPASALRAEGTLHVRIVTMKVSGQNSITWLVVSHINADSGVRRTAPPRFLERSPQKQLKYNLSLTVHRVHLNTASRINGLGESGTCSCHECIPESKMVH